MPLTFQEFDLSSARAVVHMPGGQVSPPRLLVALLERWGDIFNGEPTSLPWKMGGIMELPAEFPRLILTSDNDEFQLRISGNSAVFNWERQGGDPDYGMAEFVKRGYQILTHVLDEAPAVAGRLTLAVNRDVASEDPAQTLIKHFCYDRLARGLFKGEDDFALHTHRVYDMDPEFRVNSLVKCRTQRPNMGNSKDEGDADDTPTPQPYISVEQEISTLEEIAAEMKYSHEQILNFFSKAAPEVDRIGAIYFPEE